MTGDATTSGRTLLRQADAAVYEAERHRDGGPRVHLVGEVPPGGAREPAP